MNAITTCDLRSGRATAWVPPESSNRLPLERLRTVLHGPLRDLFSGGSFESSRGLTLNFSVSKPTDRGRIKAGLRQIGVIAN
jgi:hypothetical protein